MKTFLVTGGAGFIGGNFVLLLLQREDVRVVNLDALTYAGNLDTLEPVKDNPRHVFVEGDIRDRDLLRRLFAEHRPDCVVNFAAESHVDRSIDSPGEFILTNVVGTFEMLEAARAYWMELQGEAKDAFRFLHVSTDEVYGSLGETGKFTETTPYAPNSPYSASKAGSDHLVRAWRETYGLPTIVTNCSNNYGPYHFPEKLIPLTILNALEGKPLPVYGRGENVRDWLFVDDHAAALMLVAHKGLVGQSYNVGGRNEKKNIEVVETICAILDELRPRPAAPRRDLITFVVDRPGHDLRYAIDCSKIERELGWRPNETFETGLRKTVLWYLENRAWWQAIRDGKYRGERLGALQ